MFSCGRGIMIATTMLALTPFLIAQVAAVDVDHISNWPAPLYFQPGSSHVAEPGHHGRIREGIAIKAAAATAAAPAVFVAMSPCRVIETRNSNGPYGGPAFAASETRTYAIPSGPCAGIPASAVAFSVNITVVPLGTTMKWLTAWDTGSLQPKAATLTDYTGQISSSAAVVPAGTGGKIDIYVTDQTHVIVDMNGYYAPAAPSHAYATSDGGGVPLGFDTSTLLTLTVPAGSYIIDYHTGLSNSGSSQAGVVCGLGYNGPASLTDSEAVDPAGVFYVATTLASHDAQTFATTTTISLGCVRIDVGSGITNAINFFLRATAIGGIN